MPTFIIAAFWIGFCIIVAIAAERRFHRDPVGWLVLSLLISPLLAGLALLAVGPKVEVFAPEQRYQALAKSRQEQPSLEMNVLAFGVGFATLLGLGLAIWWG